MPWIQVALSNESWWWTVETVVQFGGRELLVVPETERRGACVKMEYERALIHVRRFLDALSFVTDFEMADAFYIGSGRPEVGVGRPAPISRRIQGAAPSRLPAPSNPKKMLALALYREALTVNSVPYSFLGFYKVLNVLHEGGRALKRWVNSTWPQLAGEARARAEALVADGQNVGRYLYESGRCAVAHAYAMPVVDPDLEEDRRRLKKDMPLVKALARYVIEHEISDA